jgi:WD40 repeat protein
MFGHPEPMLTAPTFAQRSPNGAFFYRDLVTRGETRSQFATLDGDGATVRLYPNGRIVLVPQGRSEREIAFGGLAFVELSPDRRAILMAGENGDGRVYSLTEMAVLPLATGRFADFERSQPRGPVFSPDGRYVAAMRNVDSEVLVVDVVNGRSFELSTFEESDEMFAGVRARNGVDRILFAEGRIFASTIGGEVIHVWNAANPNRREELQVATNRELMQRIRESGLELLGDRELGRSSPDGRFNLQAVPRGEVSLQSRGSGRTLATFEPIRSSPLRASAFSADGRRLATLSAQGDIAVWDLSSLNQSFDQGAAWVCARLLTQPELRYFSAAEITSDPLLRERGVDARFDLCAQ